MSPVEFRKTIEKMHDEGVRIFVEVGPRGNLSSFVDDTLRGRPHLAVPVDSFSRPGIAQLNHFVGLLAVHGVPVKLDALYRGRRVRKMAAGASPEKARRPMKVEVGWIPMGLSDELAAKLRGRAPAVEASSKRSAVSGPSIHAAVPPSNGTHSATKASPASIPRESAPITTSIQGIQGIQPIQPSDEVMTSYWKTMEQFLAVQQEVMDGFLTGRPAAPPQVVSPPPRRLEEATVLEKPPLEAPPVAVEVPEVRAASSPGSDGTRELLLKIVSERTGYPVEMIGLDLDLEADLGIDSIKRVEILGSLQQQSPLVGGDDMESLSAQKTLGDVIRYLEGRSTGSAGSPAPKSLPFIRAIEKRVAGEELSASAVLDLGEDLFLRDHALGRGVSTSDPELTGLPVVPLTMGMEMLAEAALALAADPDRKVIGMRDVRAYRWMMLDGSQLPLENRGPESRESRWAQWA